MSSSRSPYAEGPSCTELMDQVEKVLHGNSFTSSETLRALLRYLAQSTVQSPGQRPKEHEIATRLLGSPSDFDPKLDPVVRVQVSRLRSKLAEYYVSEGVNDRVYIEIPKGAYLLRPTYRAQIAPPVPALPAESGTTSLRHTSRSWLAVAIMAVLGLAGTAAWWELVTSVPDHGIRQFWRPFLESNKEPLVIFANPKMVGSSTSGLRLYDSERDQGTPVNSNYAGVGEVMAAAEISRMFSHLGRHIRLKPSQLFSWDDAKAYNLIFMGAPPHNVSLLRLPIGRKLKLKPFGEEPRPQEGCIRNIQPEKGENDLYCTSYDGAITTEYSLVTLSTGLQDGRIVLVAAGATTLGTQATVEYLCDPERVPQIARLLHLQLKQRMPPQFDALIRCRIRSGTPVSAEVVLAKQ